MTFATNSTLGALALLSLCPLVGRADETVLAWKLKAGDKLQVTRVQHTTSTTTVANKPPVRTLVETTVEMTWTVESVEDGSAKITQSLDRIFTKMDAGSGIVEFDSSSQVKPVAAVKVLADGVLLLVGGTFQVTMSPRGEIENLTPSDKLAKVFTSSKDAATAAEGFSTEGIAKLLKQPLLLLPESVVEPDATWEAKRDLPSALGTLTQTLTYRFVGLGEGDNAKIARIEIRGALAAPKPAADAPKLKANAQFGAAEFDVAAGRLMELVVTQSLELASVYANTPLGVTTESKVTTKVAPATP